MTDLAPKRVAELRALDAAVEATLFSPEIGPFKPWPEGVALARALWDNRKGLIERRTAGR